MLSNILGSQITSETCLNIQTSYVRSALLEGIYVMLYILTSYVCVRDVSSNGLCSASEFLLNQNRKFYPKILLNDFCSD